LGVFLGFFSFLCDYYCFWVLTSLMIVYKDVWGVIHVNYKLRYVGRFASCMSGEVAKFRKIEQISWKNCKKIAKKL